jgi:hypothetical protein
MYYTASHSRRRSYSQWPPARTKTSHRSRICKAQWCCWIYAFRMWWLDFVFNIVVCTRSGRSPANVIVKLRGFCCSMWLPPNRRLGEDLQPNYGAVPVQGWCHWRDMQPVCQGLPAESFPHSTVHQYVSHSVPGRESWHSCVRKGWHEKASSLVAGITLKLRGANRRAASAPTQPKV